MEVYQERNRIHWRLERMRSDPLEVGENEIGSNGGWSDCYGLKQ